MPLHSGGADLKHSSFVAEYIEEEGVVKLGEFDVQVSYLVLPSQLEPLLDMLTIVL